jgi:putative phage-type endonuclease
MGKTEIQQNTWEWHEARKGLVTASNVGAILGHDPSRTRVDVMRAMVRACLGAPPEFTGNIATEYGNRFEDQAAEELALALGVELLPGGWFRREDWAGASPDRLMPSGVDLIEIKCPFSLRDARPPALFKSIDEQPHYHDQMQFQLWVCEALSCLFWQWCPADALGEVIWPSDEWQAENLPKLRQFHAEFLDELANNADEHLAPKRVEIDTPEAHKLAAEYDELAEAIGNAKARQADILKEAVRLSGGKNATFAGRNLTQVNRAGSISYAKALKDIAPEADLEPYRGKPSSYWMMKG